MKRKKLSSSTKKYPQFAFRIPTVQEKEKLQERLHDLKERCNPKDRPKDESVVNINDIILEALNRGLASLEKEYPPKKRDRT